MTIIYQYKVATTSFFGFFSLLRRWRGSVYKLIYVDAALFSALYATISLVYRYGLNDNQKRTFEHIARYCNSYTNLIPISFVLGFYVTVVVQRWWQQFSNVPWPDRTLYVLGSYLVGLDEHGRILRRTVARYMLFAWILILRSVSVSVMKRYPTLQHIVEAGYITHEEATMYEKVECQYNKFWVPLVWANGVLTRARKEGRIESEIGFRLVIEYIADFRDKCSLCFVYDWITIPLVYTQVVTLAVYTFFGACLIGRQYFEANGNADLYVPFFTLLQFFFYMGWLKVAEQMINPFGEDDDDYDMNWLLDRHTAVAFCLVDQCHANYPPLVKDIHFNEIEPELPYTEAAMSSKRPNFMGSTYNIPRPSLVEQQIRRLSRRYIDGSGNIPHSESKVRFRTGSKLSLFGFKPSMSRSSMANSRENIKFSTMEKQGGFGPLDSSDQFQSDQKDNTSIPTSIEIPVPTTTELPPEYVPLKHLHTNKTKKHKSEDRKQKLSRGRKWSFPVNLLRKKSSQRTETGRGISVATFPLQLDEESLKPAHAEGAVKFHLEPDEKPTKNVSSRFKVEAVRETNENSSTREEQEYDPKIHAGVYRPTILSAIEEGNTVTSVKELFGSNISKGSDALKEARDDGHENDVFVENELQRFPSADKVSLDARQTRLIASRPTGQIVKAKSAEHIPLRPMDTENANPKTNKGITNLQVSQDTDRSSPVSSPVTVTKSVHYSPPADRHKFLSP